MASIRRIVLDVLKPHEPELMTFARRIGTLETVDAVRASVIEIDRDVQNVQVVVEGEAIDDESVSTTIRDLGATIHSVDEVTAGEYPLDPPPSSSADRPTWLR